ncbi:hypothetical protein BDV93DRAFT_603792 [Ceratobasidium sp. AG-I]|nr:hypothetical protein BDV93DRAFT_603792 [Ceratobasidium sp. AG-I]
MARFVDIEGQKLSEPGASIHWGRPLADPDPSGNEERPSTFKTHRPPPEPLDLVFFPSPQEKEIKANKYQRCACTSNGWSTRPLTFCGPYPPEVPAPIRRVF